MSLDETRARVAALAIEALQIEDVDLLVEASVTAEEHCWRELALAVATLQRHAITTLGEEASS